MTARDFLFLGHSVELSGIADAMDMASNEAAHYLNKATGEVILASEEKMGDVKLV